MKITWFGGSTFRVQIGGQVIVLEPHAAPAGIDQTELVSGADRVVTAGAAPAEVDADSWRPRAAERLLDAGGGLRPVELWRVGTDGLVIDGDDDTPLVLAGSPVPDLGRWSEKAVVVLFGADLAARAGQLLDARNPRLIALAGEEAELGPTIAAIRDRLDGTGLVALEPGLAVEA